MIHEYGVVEWGLTLTEAKELVDKMDPKTAFYAVFVKDGDIYHVATRNKPYYHIPFTYPHYEIMEKKFTEDRDSKLKETPE